MLVLCGLFAALTAICSYINIPLGFTPIPMNLAMLAVFLSGGILGRKYGTVSMAVYVLMGAVGLPVFAGFQSGLGVVAGPTGGFLAGYIAAAFVIGAVIEIPEKAASSKTAGNGTSILSSPDSDSKLAGISRRRKTALYMIAMIAGLIICYALGTLWFMVLMSTNVYAALAACVLPFIPGDIIKIIAAAFLTERLRNVISS